MRKEILKAVKIPSSNNLTDEAISNSINLLISIHVIVSWNADDGT